MSDTVTVTFHFLLFGQFLGFSADSLKASSASAACRARKDSDVVVAFRPGKGTGSECELQVGDGVRSMLVRVSESIRPPGALAVFDCPISATISPVRPRYRPQRRGAGDLEYYRDIPDMQDDSHDWWFWSIIVKMEYLGISGAEIRAVGVARYRVGLGFGNRT